MSKTKLWWSNKPPEPSSCEDVIYLLEGGSSVDGMGPGVPAGWTADRRVALKWFKKVRSSQYSTGKVTEVLPFEEKQR